MDYTPTERRILTVLSDGERHTKYEIRDCLYDELSNIRTVTVAMTRLRKKLPPGQAILSEYSYGHFFYRHVNLRGRNRKILGE